MRTIIQISDLHFSRTDDEVVRAIGSELKAHNPDALIISGDLTQRAKIPEYLAVADFIKNLPNVKVIVPGNHDIPLYNIWARFLSPLERYKKYISEELEPIYSDEEITIIGINTARSLAFKGGRISKRQLERIEKIVSTAPPESFKLLVTHHPLSDMWNDPTEHLIKIGIDAFAFGHRHKSSYTEITQPYQHNLKFGLVLQAGTATSTRYRNENNSYTLMKISSEVATIELHRWDVEHKRFILISSTDFIIRR